MFLKASPVTDLTAKNYRNLAYRNLVLIGGKKREGERQRQTEKKRSLFGLTVRVYHYSCFSHLVFYKSLCEPCFYPTFSCNKPTPEEGSLPKIWEFYAHFLFYFDFVSHIYILGAVK